ncbi:uncharacterized protein LAESUDRAFT_764536 [Laetiporus sulphureus 93-53]|uniref:Uncharacterized protein n=1 Tax=Laetiporus sulphureus 93-53 TaxID=1314785 RepID=A0A165B992_9APHY|nr:uncharacterized protein LAESUDRAFT_764536 [Laetiporus sulphureus 93-53]KZT00539.1 hypothetical protein LAESUDRAFT_764536 [Laetiporus sulphureus 93-53]
MELEPQPPSASTSTWGSVPGFTVSSVPSDEITLHTSNLTLAMHQAVQPWQSQGPSEMLHDMDCTIDATFMVNKAMLRVLNTAYAKYWMNSIMNPLMFQCFKKALASYSGTTEAGSPSATAQPPAPTSSSGPDLTVALQDLRSALDARLDALETQMVTVTPPSQMKAPPSFQTSAATSRPAPLMMTSNPPTSSKAPGPKHAPEPLRYVVHFAGSVLAHLLQMPPA